MAKYNEQLQRIWHAYEEATGVASTLRDAVAWGIAKGMIKPQATDPLDRLVEDMSKALREETRVDKYGRRHRVNHAMRITRAGVQYTLWAGVDKAERPFMEKSFGQRRKQIVGDCVHLKTDADVYNDAHPKQEPIQIVLDFTQDVEEALGLYDEAAG